MKYTLIFDWDGTLHDTKALYGAAFRTAYEWLTQNGWTPPRHYTDEEVSVYLGMSAPMMWETFQPQLPAEIKQRASNIIGEQMLFGVRAGHSALYEGTVETLERLRAEGYRMVFLSNCKRAYQEVHREVFRLERWFSGFYCCEDFGFRPKHEIFPVIRAEHPAPFVVIGDRAADMEIASVHGLLSIGCGYGFGSSGELKNATAIAEDVRQLPQLLAEITNKN